MVLLLLSPGGDVGSVPRTRRFYDMLEKLIIGAIVVAALIYTVRRMLRSGKSASCGCGCSSCGSSEKDKCGQ